MHETDCEILNESTIASPLVSVIVPVYNMEKNGFLVPCLDSLVSQNLREIEIICIDDASTDNSLEILLDYARQYPTITVLAMRKNSGQGAARNRGIDLARGDYIGFVDADDYVDCNFFATLYKKSQESDATVVEAPVRIADEAGTNIGAPKLSFPLEFADARVLSDEERERLIIEHPHSVQCIFASTLLKLETSRFLEGMAYEDTPTFIRWVDHIRSLSQVSDTAYYYRQNPLSTVHTTILGSQRLRDRLRSSEMILDDAMRLGYYDRYRRALNQYYLDVYYFNTLLALFGAIGPVTADDMSFAMALSARARTRVPDWKRALLRRNFSIKAKIKKIWQLGSPSSFYRLRKRKEQTKSFLFRGKAGTGDKARTV